DPEPRHHRPDRPPRPAPAAAQRGRRTLGRHDRPATRSSGLWAAAPEPRAPAPHTDAAQRAGPAQPRNPGAWRAGAPVAQAGGDLGRWCTAVRPAERLDGLGVGEHSLLGRPAAGFDTLAGEGTPELPLRPPLAGTAGRRGRHAHEHARPGFAGLEAAGT